MENFKTIVIGICIFLGLAIIGLSNRYEMQRYGDQIVKLNKLTGQVYVFMKSNGKLTWVELKGNKE